MNIKNTNKQYGGVGFGIVMMIAVVVVPVVLFVAFYALGAFTMPAGARVTLPAVATSPKAKGEPEFAMAADDRTVPTPISMPKVALASPQAEHGLSIEPIEGGNLRLSIPGWCALYCADQSTGPWTFVQNYFEPETLTIEPSNQAFFRVQPIRP